MSPYDPYAGGWVRPGWWQPTPPQRGRGWAGGWEQEPTPWQSRNLVTFLNAIMPMMRTEEDILAVARQISTLVGGRSPFGGYAGATTTGGQPTSPAGLWGQAIAGIQHQGGDWERSARANEAMRTWLQGIGGLATQHGMGVVAPGKQGATREQQRGFGQAFGQALKGGPAGGEMYAPWLQKLFRPSVSRPMPGQYQYDPQSRRWDVLRNPRFR